MRAWIHRSLVAVLAIVTVFAWGVPAQAKPQLVDQIVAVVGDQVLLQSDVMSEVASAAMQQGISRQDLTPARIQKMFDTELNKMIEEKLLLAKAKEDSLTADDEMIEDAVRARIRGLKEDRGEAEFARQLQEAGLTERELRDQFRQEYRQEALTHQMYSKLMEKVEISYGDVEEFLKAHQDTLPKLLSISHILIPVEPSPARAAEAKKRAEALVVKLRHGADFAQLARQYSDDPGSAQSGGELGFFTRDRMVPEFADVAFSLKPGQISDPVRTEFGYHIIQVEQVRGDEVRARHILIALRPNAEDAKVAYQKADSLYKRIQAGADFAKLAKEYSADKETAKQGGRLPGLYSLENLPPAFAAEIQKMKLGEVSPPVKSEHGWHLVKLNDDRDAVEDILKQVRLQALFHKVLEETRQKLYVNIRKVSLPGE